MGNIIIPYWGSGNSAILSLNSVTVNNNTPGQIDLVFNIPVTVLNLGWSFDMLPGAYTRAITGVSGSGTTWALTVDTNFRQYIDKGDLIYTTASGGVIAVSGGAEMANTIQAITNNVVDTAYYTKSIPGTGTNGDYLQIETLALSNYDPGTNWSFVIWLKPPVTATAFEGIFSSDDNNDGNDNIFFIDLQANTIDGNEFDIRGQLRTAINGTLATPIFSGNSINTGNGLTQGAAKDKVMICLTLGDAGGGTFDITSYMNGAQQLTVNRPERHTLIEMFNFLMDRGVSGWFGNSEISGVRFYDGKEMTPLEVAREWNRGLGIPAQFTTLFDIHCDVVVQDVSNFFVSDDSLNNNRLQIIGFTNQLTLPQNFVNDLGTNVVKRVICAGDSFTFGGLASEGSKYPDLLLKKLTQEFFVLNSGRGGHQTTDLITEFDTVDKIHMSAVFNSVIYVVFIGTNDFAASNLTTAQSVFDNVKSICQSGKDNGAQVVVVTMLPRGNTHANFESRRQSFNTLVRDEVSPPWDAIADMGADLNMGQPGDETDLTYYNADQAHPNDTGNDVIATVVKAAIDTL